MPRRPLEILNVLVLLILLGLTLYGGMTERFPQWPHWLWRFGVMLAAVLAMAWIVEWGRRRGRLPWVLLILVNFYPLALVPEIFNAVGYLIPSVNPLMRDQWLIDVDQAIFGFDPQMAMQAYITPWLVNLMYVGYCTYYFFPLAVGLGLWLKQRELAVRFIFVTALAFYISYIGYFAVPAYGPRTAQAHEYDVPLNITPLARAVADTLNNLEKTKQDAFPSGHTMITVVCLMFAARYRPRLFIVLLPIATLLIASTMFCRYHYAIDVIAGIVLAFATVPVANWLYNMGRERTRLPEGHLALDASGDRIDTASPAIAQPRRSLS